MMDKSRAPENNTTPVFKDRGSQKQQHEQKKKESFIRSNRQLLPAKFSLSIQPNAGLCRVEFNRKPWNKFKIQVIPPKACSDSFLFFLYSLLHLREAINLEFLHSAEATTGPEVKPVEQMKTRDCLGAR